MDISRCRKAPVFDSEATPAPVGIGERHDAGLGRGLVPSDSSSAPAGAISRVGVNPRRLAPPANLKRASGTSALESAKLWANIYPRAPAHAKQIQSPVVMIIGS